MLGCRDARERRRSIRRGASALEFVGLFAALTGGLVLGSLYLGVDVKGAARRLLNQSAASKPAVAVTPPANETPVRPAVQAPAAAPATPIAEPAEAEANVETDPTTASRADSSLIASLELTDEQRRQLTRVYWNALNGYMKKEVDHRTHSVGTGGDLALYDLLQARSEGHDAAAKAIAELETNGVDARVLAYGEKALAWHQEGAKLYARAKDLLTDAPTAQLSGPFAQSWQSAATQHQMEERLLAEKREAVRSYLGHEGSPKE
jgi:hypothetical protein